MKQYRGLSRNKVANPKSWSLPHSTIVSLHPLRTGTQPAAIIFLIALTLGFILPSAAKAQTSVPKKIVSAKICYPDRGKACADCGGIGGQESVSVRVSVDPANRGFSCQSVAHASLRKLSRI